jgi:hypothetical protein
VQELVKAGETLEAVLKKSIVPAFRERLSAWIEVFGKANLGVYDFDFAKRHERGLVGHFAQEVGLPSSAQQMLGDIRFNESMSAEAVMLLSTLNELRPRLVDGLPSPDRTLHDTGLFSRIQGSPFTLPDVVLERTRRHAEPEIAWLERDFGLRLVGSSPHVARTDVKLFASEGFRTSLVNLIWELARQAEERIAVCSADMDRRHATPRRSA